MSLSCVRATGAVAIAATLAPKRAFNLVEVRVHLSAAGGAGNLTITADNNAGAAYDFNMLTHDMTLETDYIYHPIKPIPFEALDEIDVAWANAGGKTYGLEIWYETR